MVAQTHQPKPKIKKKNKKQRERERERGLMWVGEEEETLVNERANRKCFLFEKRENVFWLG